MNVHVAESGLQLRSLITKDGKLELSLAKVKVPEPNDDEVLVRVEATPLNPSDLGLLFGPADMTTAKASGTADSPVITASVPQQTLKGLAARLDQSMPVGNEGAGVVVKAGANAKALLGKTVSMIGGGMYAQYRCLKARDCQVLPEGTTRGRRRLVVRQSADGACHDRDHAPRRPHRAGAHGGRLQSRPDAEQDLPQGRHQSGQHRPQRGAGEDPARARRQAHLRFVVAGLPRGSDESAGRDRRNDRLRCDRRRQAGRADPQLHGSGREPRTRRATAATARPCTSRSTSTAASTRDRPNSAATSAWPGASAASC